MLRESMLRESMPLQVGPDQLDAFRLSRKRSRVRMKEMLLFSILAQMKTTQVRGAEDEEAAVWAGVDIRSGQN